MIAQGRVQITIADIPQILYSEAKVVHGEEWVTVSIADSHTQVIRIEECGKVVFQKEPEVCNADDKEDEYSIAGIKARDVFDFATQVPLEMIDFIREAAILNSTDGQILQIMLNKQ